MNRIRVIQTLFHLLKMPMFAGVLLASSAILADTYPSLNEDQILWLGEQIYKNECNSQPACLTAWYQENQQEIFTESFPDLILFMRRSDIEIPEWVMTTNLEAPWQDRKSFLADVSSERMTELRSFLASHPREQANFIIDRFEDSLAAILDSATSDQKDIDSEQDIDSLQMQIQENFYKVAGSHAPYGLYALIDYVNFKGTGVSPFETYNGQGWGLKQVLLEMEDLDELTELPNSLQAFAEAAKKVLARRVENAPEQRNENRWLTGWNNRLETYLPPL